MNKVDYQVLLFIIIFVVILNSRENLYNVGYAKRPLGYYSVHYTGWLDFLLSDSEIAWVKSPNMDKDTTFDNLSDVKTFLIT